MTGVGGFLGGITYKYLSKKHKVFSICRNCYDNNWKNIESHFNPDTLINFGWGGANNSKELNLPLQIDNIKNNIDLFNLSLSSGVKNFVFISSSWVYGNYTDILSENYKCNPINLYGFSKYTIENILRVCAEINNINLLIVRPFFIYGPGDNKNKFIPTIVNKCLKNEDIEINFPERQIDYLYIDDFLSGLEILLDKKANGIYNMCSGNGYKISEITEKLKIITNSKSKITYKEDNSDIKYWVGNNSKLKSFDWDSKTNIKDGLSKLIISQKQ